MFGGLAGRTHRTADVALLLHPHSGILDNALPILRALRERRSDTTAVLLVGDRDFLTRRRFLGDPIRLALGLVDLVVLGPWSGGQRWRQHRFTPTTLERTLRAEWWWDRLLKRVETAVRLPRMVRRRLVQALSRLLRLSRRADLRAVVGPNTLVLADIEEIGGGAWEALTATVDRVRMLSIPHGIDPWWDIAVGGAAPDLSGCSLERVFAVSSRDESRLLPLFPAVPGVVEVVPVPRHDESWRLHVVARSRSDLPSPRVVFFSRKGGPRQPYLPSDLRERIIREVYEESRSRRLVLVLRLHPAEGGDGGLGRILPSFDEGTGWMLSGEHPFALCAEAVAAVAFGSSTLADANFCGTPAIEYQDLRAMPLDDLVMPARGVRFRDLPRAIDGAPALSQFGRLGMAWPAHSREQLAAGLDAALERRSEVVAQQRAAYLRYYDSPLGLGSGAERIAEVMADLLGERGRDGN